MDFQQKMIEYAKYGFSVRTSSNNGVEYYMVTLTFGTKWKVQMPIEYEGQKVMCAKVRDDGTYCYMSETSNGMQPIFELIDETIRYNEELEKKVELLKVKAEELKELFANKSYDELLMLEFVFKTPVTEEAQKVKRPTKSSKKTSQKPQNEPKIEKTGTNDNVEIKKEKETVPSVSEIDMKIAAAIGK